MIINLLSICAVFLFGMFVSNTATASSKCSTNSFCNGSSLGEQFDYRGQSTFGRLSPGDTTRVKVVLYSNNDVRIALCADQILGNVNFRVIKAVREYNRVIDRIETKNVDQKIFRLDETGNKIPTKNEAGTFVKDAYGEYVFEVEKVVPVSVVDTVWRTERNVREEIIFDSNSDKASKEFFQDKITKTTSVIIEVVVPPLDMDPKEQIEGCVGIMVGRRFAK